MADLPAHLTIPDGLKSTEIQALATCLAAMAGHHSQGGDAPILAPAMLLGHTALAPYAERMKALAGMGMVHESQSFARMSPLPEDTPLNILANLTEKGPSRVFDFSLVDENSNNFETMQTRLREVSPEDMAKFKGSRFPPHMDKGDVIWRDSRPFDKTAVAAYLELARDPNPIHVSDAAAQAVGLERAVVPGMFFAGVIENVLAEVLPGNPLTMMKLRFMAPVAIGEVLRFGVLVRTKHATGAPKAVRVFVLRQDEVIAAIADIEVMADGQAT